MLFYFVGWRSLHAKVDKIVQLLQASATQEKKIMAKFDDLNAALTRNTDAQEAVIQMLDTYVQELKDARAANDPAAMDAAIARIDANTAKAAAAVVAHTPAAPSAS